MAEEATQRLPALRDDLHIYPSSRDILGAPVWVVFDPVRNQYYQINEEGFQILSCWRQGTPEKVVVSVRQRFGVELEESRIREFLVFLIGAELVVADSPYLRLRLSEAKQAKEQGFLAWLTHRYLFFRIPLVRPDRFLDWLYPRIRPLISGRFLRITLLIGLLAVFLTVQRWQDFVSAVPWFFTLEGMLVFASVLAVVKVIHELGHGLACKHFGVGVPTMGVAFMVMWPVLYTDATDSWRLRGRLPRALIDSAGVITELVLACYALLFWCLLPDGILRSVMLTVATTTITLSLLVNLNPFMRFDGYFFLSDIMRIPNLQNRAFALARWQVRNWLFGFSHDRPEVLPVQTHRWMVIYAFGTWIYRFFLFLGIALLVYYFFFKALGIILFLVEIWWFILRPVVTEMKQWGPFIGAISARRRQVLAGTGIIMLMVLVVPWRGGLTLPAQMDAARVHRIYPPVEAMVARIHVQEGQQVQAGDLLLELDSPELNYELAAAELDVQRIAGVLTRMLGDDARVASRLVLEQQLVFAQTSLAALQRQRQRLLVVSAADGVIRDLDADLHQGRWVPRDAHLMTVIENADHARVLAWITEDNIDRIAAGAAGAFYAPAGSPQGRTALQIVRIETSPVVELDYPAHASVFGGVIPVSIDEQGRLVPEVGVFRVWLGPRDGAVLAPEQQIKGWVRVEAARRSLLGQLWRWVVGGLIREAGF
jgi:putative peptide zinc metalloprotease protein